MDIKSFKPRQTVYIVGDERRPRDKFSAVKAEVAKVGRKYVTISGRWGERFREAHNRDIAGSQIYTAIDTVAEEVLDALAVNWKIDWYDTGYDIEQKRRIVKTALNIRRTMGTAGAARTQADAIYPGTKLEEWFEYGGTHGKFRLRVNITTVEERQKFAAMTIAEIERRLAAAKRFSAHLEEVEYYDAGGTATAYGIAAMAGAAVVDFGSASKF